MFWIRCVRWFHCLKNLPTDYFHRVVSHETMFEDSIHAPRNAPIPDLILIKKRLLSHLLSSPRRLGQRALQKNHSIQLYTTQSLLKARK